MPMWNQNRRTVTMFMKNLGKNSNVGPIHMQEKPRSENNAELSVESGLESAAQNMMNAFHSKDSKKLMQALCDFLELHKQYNEEDEEDESEESESNFEKY